MSVFMFVAFALIAGALLLLLALKVAEAQMLRSINSPSHAHLMQERALTMEYLSPSQNRRDGTKLPASDLHDNFPREPFPEMSELRFVYLRCYIMWWMMEASRDTVERTHHTLQNLTDQLHAIDGEYLAKSSVLEMFGVLERDLLCYRDNLVGAQNKISPEDQVEDALPKVPQR